ncbi:hypothetical protein QBC32DRAFT_367009 [Pseudoneurospora amorphoporcata]|uniref:Uncharacterized protein n=1 Tax=Pseudoneurospora amorphoporcata TaxID=241081 RepID=A0AAN6P1Z9_9PEZI|nr:hypothetical protein QBC32DRAFT_367009 [Pseudoneurospora amorphoporcata]
MPKNGNSQFKPSPRSVNAVEKVFMYQTMTLLELIIHIVFVFDGPDRYNGSIIFQNQASRKASAEAAPTCVKLQQLGVVDAVWTNHSVALTWGCQDIVLFKKQERKWKGTGISNESVTKHDALALLQKGLPGVSHETALEIAQNAKQLARTMCDLFGDNADRLERNKWSVITQFETS